MREPFYDKYICLPYKRITPYIYKKKTGYSPLLFEQWLVEIFKTRIIRKTITLSKALTGNKLGN